MPDYSSFGKIFKATDAPSTGGALPPIPDKPKIAGYLPAPKTAVDEPIDAEFMPHGDDGIIDAEFTVIPANAYQPSGDGVIVGGGLWKPEFDSYTDSAMDTLHTAGANNERAQSGLARALRKATNAGESPPDEYLNFLHYAGIDGDTIRAVRDGHIPMDDASRAKRAMDMGLDPGRTWHRIDAPGKTQFLGRARHGLVYAGFTPKLAKEAAQGEATQKYPLIAGAKIAGMSGDDSKLVDAAMLDRQRLISEHHRSYKAYGLPLRNPQLRPGTGLTQHGSTWHNPAGSKLHDWDVLEDPKAVALIKENGFDGSLVRDEGGISVALVGPSGIRHSSLSVLSPQHINKSNIFYGGAGGAVLGGLLNDQSSDR